MKNIDIYRIYFLNWYKTYCDRSELDLSDETIRIQNFYFSESYDEETAKNYWNGYVAEKHIVSKLSKTSIRNSYSTNYWLEWKLCQNCIFLSFIVSKK